MRRLGTAWSIVHGPTTALLATTQRIDWKFKFLNAVGCGSLTMRNVLTYAEEKTRKGATVTHVEVVDEMIRVTGEDPYLTDTYKDVPEMCPSSAGCTWNLPRGRYPV